MTTITLPNNWIPRTDQRPLWEYLERGGTRAAMVAHRRWGKDDVALHFTACALMQRIGNYWHMLPKYEQARKVIWTAVNPHTGMKRIDEAFPLEIRTKTNQQEMKIEFKNGSTWQLVGSDNYNQFVGAAPIGITLSEYAISNPMAWAYISPMLEENNGWALFIYTARGNNHGKTMYLKALNDPLWFSQLVTAEDSEVFSEEQLARIKQDTIELYGPEVGEALFNQEYYCSFEGAQLGAYYAKQLTIARKENRIRQLPNATDQEVYTAWDLGIDDSTSIWFFQVVAGEFRFIDYYENMGEGLAHYAKALQNKPYVYGDHFLPHDVEHRTVQTGKSHREALEELGLKSIITVKRAKDSQAVLGGIEASRNILSKCWFDESKCSQGLIALESYHAEYDDVKKKLGNHPTHDWSSHGADAFRTFAVGYQPRVKQVSVTQMMSSR